MYNNIVADVLVEAKCSAVDLQEARGIGLGGEYFSFLAGEDAKGCHLGAEPSITDHLTNRDLSGVAVV